jgi:hypothetical protein
MTTDEIIDAVAALDPTDQETALCTFCGARGQQTDNPEMFGVDHRTECPWAAAVMVTGEGLPAVRRHTVGDVITIWSHRIAVDSWHVTLTGGPLDGLIDSRDNLGDPPEEIQVLVPELSVRGHYGIVASDDPVNLVWEWHNWDEIDGVELPDRTMRVDPASPM